MTDEELIARLRAYAQIEHAAAPWGFAGEGEVLSISADRIEALVKERDRYLRHLTAGAESLRRFEARAERLEAAVIAAAKIGQIVGFLGEDESRIEAFREACGPELWAKARAALKGDDHE